MMTLIQVTDDLVIEVWHSDPLLKIRSLGQGADGETPPGVLIVWPTEIGPLIESLYRSTKLLGD